MSKKKGGPPSKSIKKSSDIDKETLNEIQEKYFDAQFEAEADFYNNEYSEQKTSIPEFQQKSSQPLFQQQYKKGPSN